MAEQPPGPRLGPHRLLELRKIAAKQQPTGSTPIPPSSSDVEVKTSDRYPPPHRVLAARAAAQAKDQLGASPLTPPASDTAAKLATPPVPPVMHQTSEVDTSTKTLPTPKASALPSPQGQSRDKPSQHPAHVRGSNNPRTRANSAVPFRRKNDRWVKNSDLKVEKNWSNGAIDSGWDDWHATMQTSNGVSLGEVKDGSYGIMNWDGTWAPVPEDWDSRPPFINYQLLERIETWIKTAAAMADPQPLSWSVKHKHSENFHQDIPTESGIAKRYHFLCPPGNNDVMGDIVPVSWRPELMEGATSYAEFWSGFLVTPPRPCDDEDLVNATPWWECAPSPMACFQLPLQHPEHRGTDVTVESPYEQRLRGEDNGIEAVVKRWRQGWRPDRGRGGGLVGRGGCVVGRGFGQHTRLAGIEEADPQADEIQQEVASDPVPEPIPDKSIHPKVNLYLRRVETSDIVQITNIYNHYVNHTVRVPERSPVLSNHMHDRITRISAVSHSFLVACLASNFNAKAAYKGPGKRNKSLPVTNTDRIIGFAYSDDFNDAAGMYRFVAEVEVYVDPEFARKGVASCLMDKLTAILDPSYMERGGYEIRDEELGMGASRTVSRLWINFPYSEEDGDKAWATTWFESMGFSQTADHKDVGCKLDKSASLAVFTRRTGCEINPKLPPVGN